MRLLDWQLLASNQPAAKPAVHTQMIALEGLASPRWKEVQIYKTNCNFCNIIKLSVNGQTE